jgi:hypothetical protein
VFLLSGGVGLALRVAWRLKKPDSPRQPHTEFKFLRTYFALSLVGGPDPRTRHCQFIPFDPFLADGTLLVVLPHQDHLSERDAVSFMGVQK